MGTWTAFGDLESTRQAILKGPTTYTQPVSLALSRAFRTYRTSSDGIGSAGSSRRKAAKEGIGTL